MGSGKKTPPHIHTELHQWEQIFIRAQRSFGSFTNSDEHLFCIGVGHITSSKNTRYAGVIATINDDALLLIQCHKISNDLRVWNQSHLNKGTICMKLTSLALLIFNDNTLSVIVTLDFYNLVTFQNGDIWRNLQLFVYIGDFELFRWANQGDMLGNRSEFCS